MQTALLLLLPLAEAPAVADHSAPGDTRIGPATGCRLTPYDLSLWMVTRRIRIQPSVVPHSHPVLTVNNRYLDNGTTGARETLQGRGLDVRAGL